MKKIALILTIITVFLVSISNASAFCLFGFIGNSCGDDEEFFPPTGNVVGDDMTPLAEIIPVDSETETSEVTEDSSEVLPEEISQDFTEEERMAADIVLEVTEEDLIDLNPVAIDPDGDEIHYKFSEPFSPNGLWQTKRGDAGKYLVTITASDGELETVQEALILVYEANKIPVLECGELIRVYEGDVAKLNCNAYDPDDEALIITYEGWFDSNSRETTYDDAGTYTAQISVSDGENHAFAEVVIEVIDVNRAPIISGLNDILATETEVIVVNPDVVDLDGDAITVEFSEPLNSEGIFRTKDGDSGTYVITVTATDGKETVKETATLTVDDINTAPIVERIPDIVIFETETVVLDVVAEDPEGDEITILYEGWMDSNTKSTGYEDEGQYSVIVTVTDGELSSSQEVLITVKNKNRAPTFVIPA